MNAMRDESDRAARRIAEANAAFAPAPGEQAVAWARLRAHWDDDADPRARQRASRAGLSLLLGGGALAALAAIAWLVILRGPAGDHTARVAMRTTPPVLERASGGGETASGPTAGTTAAMTSAAAAPGPAVIGSAAAPGAPGTPEIALPEGPPAPVAMRPGRSVLADGVRARLAPQGAATVRHRSGAQPSVVSLQRGTLDMAIDSTARAAGTPSAAAATGAGDARWEVQVASYRIAADPGRFSVRAHGGRVDVVVKSGKLAVWSSRRLLATIVAGERWTNLTTDEAAPGDAPNAAIDSPATREEVPAPEAAPAGAEVPDCTRLTRQGAIDPALACFARQSAQPGLTGELALIELARIRRDVKGDLAGAEQALAEHRRRFPRGALAAEATGSRVELLLRLGRAGEALDESDHLNGSESLFWRAVCLAKLGRKTAAAQAFDDYLARTDGKRRSEATRMRDDLGPR